MGRTPDDLQGGEVDADLIILNDSGMDPANVGEIRRNGSDFIGRDGSGLFNLRSGSGLTEAQHKALRHLIHFIDDGPADGFASGAFKEILPAADPFPTSVTWWTSAAKTHKIVRKTITRSGGGATNVTPTPIVWEMYAADGTTVLVTVSDAITYSGVFETSRTRTIS